MSMKSILENFMTVRPDHATCIIIWNARIYFRCLFTVCLRSWFPKFWSQYPGNCTLGENLSYIVQGLPNQAVCDLYNDSNEIALFLVTLSDFEVIIFLPILLLFFLYIYTQGFLTCWNLNYMVWYSIFYCKLVDYFFFSTFVLR